MLKKLLVSFRTGYMINGRLIYRTLQQPHLVSILSDRLKIQDPELIRCPIEYENLSAENNDWCACLWLQEQIPAPFLPTTLYSMPGPERLGVLQQSHVCAVFVNHGWSRSIYCQPLLQPQVADIPCLYNNFLSFKVNLAPHVYRRDVEWQCTLYRQ